MKHKVTVEWNYGSDRNDIIAYCNKTFGASTKRISNKKTRKVWAVSTVINTHPRYAFKVSFRLEKDATFFAMAFA